MSDEASPITHIFVGGAIVAYCCDKASGVGMGHTSARRGLSSPYLTVLTIWFLEGFLALDKWTSRTTIAIIYITMTAFVIINLGMCIHMREHDGDTDEVYLPRIASAAWSSFLACCISS